MIFRCTESFDTCEGESPVTIDKGTIWLASYRPPSFGGYELALLEQLNEGGGFTGAQATVRMYMLSTSFELVPPDECVMIGCSEFNAQ